MRHWIWWSACTIGWHDWKYDTIIDAAGKSEYRTCDRCGKFEWLEPTAE